MIHEGHKMQRVAMWWHIVLAIGAFGGILYHGVAAIEHARAAKKESC